jgi:hypothetical protein
VLIRKIRGSNVHRLDIPAGEMPKASKVIKTRRCRKWGISCLELPLQTDRNHLGDIVLPAKVDVVVA